MVNLVELTYGTGVAFYLNPDKIESVGWDPARQQTEVVTTSGTVRHCAEDPATIKALINAASAPAPLTDIHASKSASGVGGQGPVHGDGSPFENRGAPSWQGPTSPAPYDPFASGAFSPGAVSPGRE